jgi:hypothetical protein
MRARTRQAGIGNAGVALKQTLVYFDESCGAAESESTRSQLHVRIMGGKPGWNVGDGGTGAGRAAGSRVQEKPGLGAIASLINAGFLQLSEST